MENITNHYIFEYSSVTNLLPTEVNTRCRSLDLTNLTKIIIQVVNVIHVTQIDCLTNTILLKF